MSMEVHFILNFFRLGFLLNFSNSNPCSVPQSFSCCLIDSCLPLKVSFCGFNPLQAAWNWGKVPYCAIQPICEALWFFLPNIESVQWTLRVETSSILCTLIRNLISDLSPPKSILRLCLRVWKGGEGKAFRGGKYEGKCRNLSKNLKE